MGINAHPGNISAISVSYDGRYLFSSGQSDQCSYMYEIDLTGNGQTDSGNSKNINNSYVKAVRGIEQPPQRTFSGDNLDCSRSFLTLLEGGEGGDLYEDIIEYFYYCQLRAQGEDSMEERTVSGHIPIDEIPSLMRAVGFYPSEAQVADMLNEVTSLHLNCCRSTSHDF
jgi:cilia- and flagella-associated protein 251